MKKTLLNVLPAALAVGLLFGCNTEAKRSSGETTAAANVEQTANVPAATEAAPAEALAVMTFEETEYDFGAISEGDIVKHTYKFKNTGKAPLIVQSATAQCGCTVPQKPDKPVAPGETGEIKVQFDSKGKAGVQSKAITITANTQPAETVVILKGTVNAGVASMKGPMETAN